MKLNAIRPEANEFFKALLVALLMFIAIAGCGQISLVCTDPTNVAYGLTNTGAIYEINNTTGATIRIIKNTTYPGNAPSSANGLGYSSLNTRFYYFKRNVITAPQEFVSFSPSTGRVTVLAASTCTDDIHTGCVSANGLGYYTIDIQGTLHYYDIAANKWTFITSKIVDQNGNDVSGVIKTQSAGDMAMDAFGKIWFLTSSTTNWGLYRIPGPMPTTPVAQLNVIRVIDPTRATPTGNSFAGIAFKPNGQVLMSTRGDDKLYLLQNLSTLTFLGNLTTVDVGNDLTSCVFPAGVLPVSWTNFNITVQNSNKVTLQWEVMEYNNRTFHVQHSVDGTNWEDIAVIASKNNQEAPETYSYSHINNLSGKQYYRIKQVDADEKTGYSEVLSVTLKNDKSPVTIWPNPATDQVRIAGSSIYTKAQVFDLSGRMFSETKLHGNNNTINISKLPVGTYLVKVQSDNGTCYSQKIFKQ